MAIANENTKIIHGHLGPRGRGFKEIQQQLVMFTAVPRRVLSAIRAETLEQVVASKPTADFDPGRLGEPSPDRFVTLVTDLARTAR